MIFSLGGKNKRNSIKRTTGTLLNRVFQRFRLKNRKRRLMEISYGFAHRKYHYVTRMTKSSESLAFTMILPNGNAPKKKNKYSNSICNIPRSWRVSVY